jgi:hypothetical protein
LAATLALLIQDAFDGSVPTAVLDRAEPVVPFAAHTQRFNGCRRVSAKDRLELGAA